MSYEFSIYIDGQWIETSEVLSVISPFSGSEIGTTFKAGPAHIEQAIAAAANAFHKTRVMPVYERAEKLLHVSAGINDHLQEFAQILSAEAGKPIKTARQEVQRAVFTLTNAAEECKRIYGEEFPLDLDSGSKNRWALVRRYPIGPILGITPFNFPLNLVCHKVAPALAAGNPIIIKPASSTPFSALRLAQEFAAADWPAGSLQVLPMDSRNAHLMVADDRLKMLTFTGSPDVGWVLKNQAGRKRVTLELGGNAGVIIHHDANVEYSATRCVLGGFSYAGQSCISVQRIFLHENIYDRFMSLFIEKVKGLKIGDPADETTDVGPMIHSSEINRVRSWIAEAVAAKATVITGGKATGNLLEPTVLTEVRSDLKISCQEVFAPLVVVFKYSDIQKALQQVNDSEFGLQAGLFTRDAQLIFRAFDILEVGGVIVGDVPTYRIDHMPYGGSKQSGMGREGARYAIEEMTEPKLLVMNLPE